MISRALPYYEFAQGVFEIDEFDCASIFVIVGSERALVIDTGVGIGDLKWVIENRITDKPYDVVMTHNHGDHIGGAGWFQNVWIHPADSNWEQPNTAPTLEFRRNYAKTISLREHKHYNYEIERDIRPWPAIPCQHALQDAQTFDLGGRKVTAYHCPGHTPGEMVLIDDLARILFFGDACNCNLLLSREIASNGLERYKIALQGLRRIAGMENQYDCMYNSHHDYRGFGSPLAPDVLDDAIKCLEGLINHSASYKKVADPLFLEREPKTVASYGKVMVSYIDGSIAEP